MFPSLGLINIYCPYFENPECNRPYCHFKHIKLRTEKKIKPIFQVQSLIENEGRQFNTGVKDESPSKTENCISCEVSNNDAMENKKTKVVHNNKEIKISKEDKDLTRKEYVNETNQPVHRPDMDANIGAAKANKTIDRYLKHEETKNQTTENCARKIRIAHEVRFLPMGKKERREKIRQLALKKFQKDEPAMSNINQPRPRIVPVFNYNALMLEKQAILKSWRKNPNKPELSLEPTVPLVCLEYNPKDTHVLVSGLFSGQVAFWDTRRGAEPVEVSLLESSHRDPVHNVLWINSKSGTEFFSASSDGQIKWWDNRKLSEPLETLILDVQKGEAQVMSRAFGASSLEYETTIPTRFMVGTENGYVISGNRKGKNANEKIAGYFKAHLGPVCALQRNTAFVKNFLTVGDWTARIWSEDCKESSIIWTSYHEAMLTDGSWSPARFSAFFTTRTDGTLDVWDVLQQQREAILSVKVCDDPLRCLRVHEGGQLVAVGNDRGTTYLVEFSENLASNHKNDKALLTAMFERESRREKILEAKIREIRLKGRAKIIEPTAPQVQIEPIERVNYCKVAEEEFDETVKKELEDYILKAKNKKEKKRKGKKKDEDGATGSDGKNDTDGAGPSDQVSSNDTEGH